LSFEGYIRPRIERSGVHRRLKPTPSDQRLRAGVPRFEQTAKVASILSVQPSGSPAKRRRIALPERIRSMITVTIPAYIEIGSDAFVATRKATLADWIAAIRCERGSRSRLARQLVQIATEDQTCTVAGDRPLLPQLLA
jgi:hypothetical protein